MSMRQQKIADNVVNLLKRLEDVEKYCEAILGYSQKKSLDNNPPDSMLEKRKRILEIINRAYNNVESLNIDISNDLYELGIRW